MKNGMMEKEDATARRRVLANGRSKLLNCRIVGVELRGGVTSRAVLIDSEKHPRATRRVGALVSAAPRRRTLLFRRVPATAVPLAGAELSGASNTPTGIPSRINGAPRQSLSARSFEPLHVGLPATL